MRSWLDDESVPKESVEGDTLNMQPTCGCIEGLTGGRSNGFELADG